MVLRTFVVGLVFAGLSVCLSAATVCAAEFTVTSLADDGRSGELRAAMTAANGQPGSKITFDLALHGTISLARPLPTITASMTIHGPGAAEMTIDGENRFRAFVINGKGAVATISGLGIEHCTDQADGAGGGAIAVSSGYLILRKCMLTNNGAPGANGIGGAIYVADNASVANCTLSENTATLHGGAIFVEQNSTVTISKSALSANSTANDGGAIENVGSLFMTGCNVSGNRAATSGGGIENGAPYTGDAMLRSCTLSANCASNAGGAIDNEGKITLASCTLSKNSATFRGGAICSNQNASSTLTDCTLERNSTNGGGGGVESLGLSSLTNCTLYKNHAENNGGAIECGSRPAGNITMTNCTLWRNSASIGGGGIDNSGTTSITNCILYGDKGGEVTGDSVIASHCDVPAGTSIIDNGGNIYSDPELDHAELASNGGETQTIVLGSGSQCRGAGTENGAPSTDQRGFRRSNPPSIGSCN